jgi:SAM-dependent methyltransferase
MNEINRPNQRHYWDQNLDPTNLGAELADARAVIAAEEDFYLVPDRQRFLDALRPYAHPMVLELGAGLSYQVIALAQRGCTVLACDLSLARLRLLRQLVSELLPPTDATRVHYIACRAESLPFLAASVDVVATRAVLIHTDLECAIAECQRVLKPEGKAIFTEPQRRHPLVNLYRRTLAPKEWKTIARYFDTDEISVVHKHFARVDAYYDYLAAFVAFVWQYGLRSARLFWLLMRPLHTFDQWLMRWRPALSRYAWFVTLICGKKP